MGWSIANSNKGQKRTSTRVMKSSSLERKEVIGWINSGSPEVEVHDFSFPPREWRRGCCWWSKEKKKRVKVSETEFWAEEKEKERKQRECVLCCVLLSSLISHHFFVSCDWCGGGVSFLWLLTLSAVLTHTKRLTIDDWHVAFYPMSFSQPKKCCYFNSSQSHMFSVQWLTLYVIGSRRIINSLMLSSIYLCLYF